MRGLRRCARQESAHAPRPHIDRSKSPHLSRVSATHPAIQAAECTVAADYIREMDIITQGVGVSAVNAMAQGVLNGAGVSIAEDIPEVDAAVCGEPESLRRLLVQGGAELAGRVLLVAAGGGRTSVVQLVLEQQSGVVDHADKDGWTARGGKAAGWRTCSNEWQRAIDVLGHFAGGTHSQRRYPCTRVL